MSCAIGSSTTVRSASRICTEALLLSLIVRNNALRLQSMLPRRRTCGFPGKPLHQVLLLRLRGQPSLGLRRRSRMIPL